MLSVFFMCEDCRQEGITTSLNSLFSFVSETWLLPGHNKHEHASHSLTLPSTPPTGKDSSQTGTPSGPDAECGGARGSTSGLQTDAKTKADNSEKRLRVTAKQCVDVFEHGRQGEEKRKKM